VSMAETCGGDFLGADCCSSSKVVVCCLSAGCVLPPAGTNAEDNEVEAAPSSPGPTGFGNKVCMTCSPLALRSPEPLLEFCTPCSSLVSISWSFPSETSITVRAVDAGIELGALGLWHASSTRLQPEGTTGETDAAISDVAVEHDEEEEVLRVAWVGVTRFRFCALCSSVCRQDVTKT
jgi:hypothetical protein